MYWRQIRCADFTTEPYHFHINSVKEFPRAGTGTAECENNSRILREVRGLASRHLVVLNSHDIPRHEVLVETECH